MQLCLLRVVRLKGNRVKIPDSPAAVSSFILVGPHNVMATACMAQVGRQGKPTSKVRRPATGGCFITPLEERG